MGMMPIYYSTTNTKKRKQKRKPGWKEREEEHRKFLMKHGIDPDAPKKKQEFVEYKTPAVEPYRREVPNYPSCSNNIGGYAPKKESPKYTGTLIKGIATMHKSNAVPVIDKKQAEEISQMRRN